MTLSCRPLPLGRLARLCWAVDARRWLLSVVNVIAATCFVVGCVGFYWPKWYAPSVTLFLVGSILFLIGALGAALLEHGPSESHGAVLLRPFATSSQDADGDAGRLR